MGPHRLPVLGECIACSVAAPKAGRDGALSESVVCHDAHHPHSLSFSDGETDFMSNDIRTSTHVPFHSHVDGRGEGLSRGPASTSLLGCRQGMETSACFCWHLIPWHCESEVMVTFLIKESNIFLSSLIFTFLSNDKESFSFWVLGRTCYEKRRTIRRLETIPHT